MELKPSRNFDFLLFAFSCFVFTAQAWSSRRRIVSPTLSDALVKPHLDTFNEVVLKSMANFPIDGKNFDILNHLSECTLSMFTEVSIGQIDEKLRNEYCSGYHM